MEGMRSHLGAARQEREKLKAEISNLPSVIADGRQSTALPAELEKRERRLDKIREEVPASADNDLQTKLQKIEESAMKRLRDIQGLLRGNMFRAKSELAKHCTDITLAPKGNSYIVSGDWNLWADVRVFRIAPRVPQSLACRSPPDRERAIRYQIREKRRRAQHSPKNRARTISSIGNSGPPNK